MAKGSRTAKCQRNVYAQADGLHNRDSNRMRGHSATDLQYCACSADLGSLEVKAVEISCSARPRSTLKSYGTSSRAVRPANVYTRREEQCMQRMDANSTVRGVLDAAHGKDGNVRKHTPTK